MLLRRGSKINYNKFGEKRSKEEAKLIRSELDPLPADYAESLDA